MEKGAQKKLQQVEPRGSSQQDYIFCKAPTSKSLQTKKSLRETILSDTYSKMLCLEPELHGVLFCFVFWLFFV